MNEPQKRAVTIFTIILSLIPIPFILRYPNSANLHIIALYFSATIGYVGIVLMLWMYMLGTRSVSALLFKDIAPVLTIHKWLGKYAIPMIFVHPILITYSRSESWLYPLIPHIGTASERHMLLGQIAISLLAFTWFVSAYLREKIGFRPWKYLHYLAYICVPFALLHVPDLGSQVQTHIAVKAYYLLLVIVFVGFSIMRLRSLLNLDRKKYIVSSHAQLTDIDRQISVRALDTPITAPRYGQYVYIKLGYISEDHPFSVTKYAVATDEITLTYRTAGMYTRELAKLTDNSVLYVSGPFGTFTDELSRDAASPVVYIAGGIGITPFVSRILAEASSREQWLFAANRDKTTAVFSSTLKSVLQKRHIAVFSNEKSTLKKGEEAGYISAKLLARHLDDPKRYTYYICGPAPMMEAVRRELALLNVSDNDIHTEKFGW